MFYAVTDLYWLLQRYGHGSSHCNSTHLCQPYPTQPIMCPPKFNPTQPNPWVDPTHVHVCDTLLHRRPSIVDRTQQQPSIDSQLFVQNRDVCLPHVQSTPPLGSPCRNIAMTFGTEKLEWFGYPIVKNFEGKITHFELRLAHAYSATLQPACALQRTDRHFVIIRKILRRRMHKHTSLNSVICDWLKRAKTFPIFFFGSSRFVSEGLSSSSAAGGAAASSSAAAGAASSFSFSFSLSFVFSFFSFLSLSFACFEAQVQQRSNTGTQNNATSALDSRAYTDWLIDYRRGVQK